MILALFISTVHALSLDETVLNYVQRAPQVMGQMKLASYSEGDRWRRFLIHEPQVSLTNGDDSSTFSYGISLATAFPGKAFAYSTFDRVKAEGDRVEVTSKKQDATKLIAQAYVDCASGHEMLEMQKEAVENFRSLASNLKALYESGHSSQAEKIGAELQFCQAESDLEIASNRTEVACTKFRTIYGEGDPREVPEDLSSAALDTLGTESADQLRAKTQIKLAKASESLRWWAQAPDITWAVSRNHYVYQPASPSGNPWTTTFSVAVVFPFFFTESVEAHRIAAQSQVDRNVAEIVLLNADADLDDAKREFARAQKRLKQLRSTDLPLAEALVESTYAAYKTGKLGFAELINSRKTLFDLKTQDVQTRVSAISARLRCLKECAP